MRLHVDVGMPVAMAMHVSVSMAATAGRTADSSAVPALVRYHSLVVDMGRRHL